MTETDKPILITGASGNLGRMLTKALAAQGYTLRLTDILPFPDPLPAGATFTRIDLVDGMAILRIAEGCGTILHFGGIPNEQPFSAILGPNIMGLYHVYEAARREGARVVFASSNHTIGFHERDEKLDHDCDMRPDGYYGLAKCYGELMGRLYWDKHGVESVFLRIGSSFPEPINARMLSTYLSYADLARLAHRILVTPKVGCIVIWGASANARTFWGKDSRDVIGWEPQDSADTYAGQLAGKVSNDPVEERYQGGPYCSIGYSREGGFSPRETFPKA